MTQIWRFRVKLIDKDKVSFSNLITFTQNRTSIQQSAEHSGECGSGGLAIDNSDRKITRNQKRKHDEINHVQQVVDSLQVFSNRNQCNLERTT